MSDIDFIVRPNDFAAVCEVLESLGYVSEPYTRRLATQQDFYERCYRQTISKDIRILLEPHRQLIQPERHPIDYDALWSRSQPATLEGVPCRRLADEDYALHAVIHAATHTFSDLEHTLGGLELLLRHGDIHMDVLLSRAKKWHCRRACWLALILIHRRTDIAGLLDAAAQIAPSRFIQTVLLQLVSPQEGYIAQNRTLRVRQALLWPFLLDSSSTIWQFGLSYLRLRLADEQARLRQRLSTGSRK